MFVLSEATSWSDTRQKKQKYKPVPTRTQGLVRSAIPKMVKLANSQKKFTFKQYYSAEVRNNIGFIYLTIVTVKELNIISKGHTLLYMLCMIIFVYKEISSLSENKYHYTQDFTSDD